MLVLRVSWKLCIATVATSVIHNAAFARSTCCHVLLNVEHIRWKHATTHWTNTIWIILRMTTDVCPIPVHSDIYIWDFFSIKTLIFIWEWFDMYQWIPWVWKPGYRQQNQHPGSNNSWDIGVSSFWRPSWTPSWFLPPKGESDLGRLLVCCKGRH
jgi:hypothetical protein